MKKIDSSKVNRSLVPQETSTGKKKTEGTTVEGRSISWKSMDKAAFKIGKFFGFKKMAQDAYLRHTAEQLANLEHTDISKLDLKMPESLKDRKIVAFDYQILKEMLKNSNDTKDIRDKIKNFQDLTPDDIKAFLEKTLQEKGRQAVTSQSKNIPLTTFTNSSSQASFGPSSLWNETKTGALKSDTPLGRQLKPITTELNDRFLQLRSGSMDKKVEAELNSLNEFKVLISNQNLLAQVLESNPSLKKDFYSNGPSQIINNCREYIVPANKLKSHIEIITSFRKSAESKSELSSEKKFVSMMINVHNKFIDSYNKSKESDLSNVRQSKEVALKNKASETTLNIIDRDIIRVESQKINHKLTSKDVDNFSDQIIKFANQKNDQEILKNINSFIGKIEKENLSEFELIGLAGEFDKILTTLNSISVNNTKYVSENIETLFKDDEKYSKDILTRLASFSVSTELYEIGLVNKVLGPEDNEGIKQAYKKFVDRVFPS